MTHHNWGGKRPGAGRPKNEFPSKRVTVPDIYADLFLWLCRQKVDVINALIDGHDASLALQKEIVKLQIKLDCAEARAKQNLERREKFIVKASRADLNEEARKLIDEFLSGLSF